LAADWQLPISRPERLPSACRARILQDRPSINTPPLLHLERPPSQQLQQPNTMDAKNAQVSTYQHESRVLVLTRPAHFANELCPLDSSALLPRIHTSCTHCFLFPRTTWLGHNHRRKHEICKSTMAPLRCAAFTKRSAAFRQLTPMRFWPRRCSCFGKQRTGKFGMFWIEKQN
jgi:hypothetical protein